ncbi:MAG TPA: response regulator [Chloroflexi bacterium]|nr:response regulator [Chloroflexota bacterium]
MDNLSEAAQSADILIVDDNRASLALLNQVLSERGYRVRISHNGRMALELVEAQLPDLILLDIMMPDMNGYQVCAALKADERTQDIPIIFISAATEIFDKVKAFSAGGVDYITKPFQVAEVLARVKTHLALRNFQARLEEQNAQLRQIITEYQQAEQMLRQYTERLKTMHEIDQAILAGRSPEHIAVAAVGWIRHLMPCQRAAVVEITADGQINRLAAESSGEIPLRSNVHFYREMLDEAAFGNGLVHGVDDLEACLRRFSWQQTLYTDGVRSYLVIPLHVRQDLIGLLHLDSTAPRAFAADQIDTLIEIAVLLAVGIRQIRLYEQSQQEIAARKRAEEVLREYALELEARNVELDAFAHTVAHDLKNPLTTILGFSTMLEAHHKRVDAEIVLDSLQMISQTARKMNSIVKELLLFASVRRLDDVAIEVLDMAQAVNEAKSRLKDMIVEYHVEIVAAEGEDWPAAQGYGSWIEEVWVNYISNAIQYGGRPPHVELGAALQEDGAVRFWVRDNGQGLTLEEQERLFTPFTRLDHVRVKGHGLGLSIVKRIVEKLGGQVGVESRIGEGSTFWFTLPSDQV